MKTAPGDYEFKYKDCSIQVSIVGKSHAVKEWYYVVSGGKFAEPQGSGDWYWRKRDAKEAAQEFIDKAVHIPKLGWCIP